MTQLTFNKFVRKIMDMESVKVRSTFHTTIIHNDATRNSLPSLRRMSRAVVDSVQDMCGPEMSPMERIVATCNKVCHSPKIDDGPALFEE